MSKPRSELIPVEFSGSVYVLYGSEEMLTWEHVRFLEAFGDIPAGSEFEKIMVDLHSGEFYIRRAGDAVDVDPRSNRAGYRKIGRVRLVLSGEGPRVVKTG